MHDVVQYCVRYACDMTRRWANWFLIWQMTSEFRLMGGRNKTRDAAREKQRKSFMQEPAPRPAEISNQFSSLAPSPQRPSAPSHAQEGKFSYARRTTLNPYAPRQPGRARGLGWLGRSSHTRACAAGIHACAAGIAPAPRRCVWFQIGKAHLSHALCAPSEWLGWPAWLGK